MRARRHLAIAAAAICVASTAAAAPPPEAENVVHVADPLPLVEQLLASQLVRWALVSGPDAQQAFSGLFTRRPDLDAWLREVRAAKDHIPNEIALAAAPAAWAGIDRTVRLLGLMVVFEALPEAPPGVQRRERPALQQQLLDALSGFELPRVVLWARFRSERTALELFQGAAGIAGGLEQYNFTVERGDTAVGVRFRVADVLDDDQAAAVLAAFGAVVAGADPRRRALVAALRAVEIEAWLERAGDGLRLTLGPRAAGETPRAAWVAAAPPVAGDTVLAARWDVRALQDAARGWARLLDRWQRGALGAAVRRKDTEDVLGSLRYLAENVAEAGGRGALRVTRDGAALRGELHAVGAAPVTPLAGAPLLGLVPEGVEAYWISGETGLGDLLRDLFLRMEDRLAMQSLRAQVGGRDAELATVERFTETYYRSFAPLRAVLLDRLPPATPAPGAILVWSDGGLDAVLLSRARSAAEARKVVEDLLREAARGAAQALSRKLPASPRFLREEDLGLGVPVFVVDTGWMRALAGGSFGPAVRPELRPHLFFIDGQLVLSTSARASQRILAARRGGARLALPDGAAIAAARVDRRALVAVSDGLFGLLGPGAATERVRLIARSLFSLVEDARLVETASGGERRTRFEVRFGTPR